MRHKTFLTIFEQTAHEVSGKIAVVDEIEQFTYEELLTTSKMLGYALSIILQGQTQKPIMLFMDKGCKCLAAMLGVLYSGNVYVPMDVKTPLDRLHSIENTLECSIILTSELDKKYLNKIGYKREIFVYEELLHQFLNVSAEVTEQTLSEIYAKVLDTDLMYILFTSGSTGVPKGVAVMHRCLVDYVYAYQKAVGTRQEDVIGNQTPFYADMSLKDIYMSLEAGATICIIPQNYFMSPKKLLQYLDDHKVTFLAWVPTAYRIVSQFDALERVRPKSLHYFLFSGEAMPTAVYSYWRKFYPDGVYIQQYGPTEITGACTSFVVNREYSDGEIIPVGKPFDNTGILLLDEENREVAITDTLHYGEICVYGTCVSGGYYNNQEKTAEVFVQNPFRMQVPSLMYRTGDLGKWDEDGNLLFISRKDSQVKHGGRRIELGEIEAAVLRLQEIKACCCVHKRDQDILVLYYIGRLCAEEIIKVLKNSLPKYMMPSVYQSMEELPFLANGKLDRKKMDDWANGGCIHAENKQL